ncbi:PP2C family protein-serine/threonine phosphatase [Croceicoccus bisphenolivorans]|uniref:PP2C family protein-serine/threonine phosphatase n=1 Tax=Croceicoccus bisphenolivorans TaxID=1783232 RepID=UPI00082D2C89|nr:protein phosphatase 2C domain-containing protein [Croceicoccus bisphenolivorans]
MNPQFLTACQSEVGLVREINEDNYLDRPADGIWIVADGMGGHEAGEVASAMIVEAMESVRTDVDPRETTKRAMDAIQIVQKRLVSLASESSTPSTIGSTVVGLVIASGRYYCFWVGDSRGYLVRQGAITRLTRDHSLVQDLVDAKLIAPENAEGHPDANVITRAVGSRKELVIDAVSGPVHAGDIFLLATDGVTRVLDDAEICHHLTTRNPRQATTIIGEDVLSRGAPDNFTSIIIRVV